MSSSTALNPTTSPARFAMVPFDLYKDIHKGIRFDLFRLTTKVGDTDPSDDVAVAGLAEHLRSTVGLLVSHAEHEDTFCAPLMDLHVPELAPVIAEGHEVLEAQMATLEVLADAAASSSPSDRRAAVHQLYLDLAAFTADYLLHIDIEERQVMTAIASAVSVPELLEVHAALLATIPPDEMGHALSLMLPAMNVDDRTEMLGGMQQGAPPEVFAGVLELAGTLLRPTDLAAVKARIGVA